MINSRPARSFSQLVKTVRFISAQLMCKTCSVNSREIKMSEMISATQALSIAESIPLATSPNMSSSRSTRSTKSTHSALQRQNTEAKHCYGTPLQTLLAWNEVTGPLCSTRQVAIESQKPMTDYKLLFNFRSRWQLCLNWDRSNKRIAFSVQSMTLHCRHSTWREGRSACRTFKT